MSRHQYAVVLGGNMQEDGTPAPATVARARTAARLALTNPNLIVILSGSRQLTQNRQHSLSEAEAMAQILVEMGVPRQRLRLEFEARDTLGNAALACLRFLKGLAGTLYLVTSPFHMERATVIFSYVLGDAWQIVPVESAVVADDEQRARTEQGGIDYAHRFFLGMEPGDLTECCRRLLERRPHYRGIAVIEEGAGQESLAACA